MRRFYYILFILFTLSACFEEDKMVLPYPGEVTTITHNISDYQSYFDFETNNVVKINHINEWDMAFGCSVNSWHVRVNSGYELFVLISELNNIDDPFQNTGNEEWKYDNPVGNPDSSAVGVWCDTTVFPYLSKGLIYILAKKDAEGNTNYIQFQMIAADSVSYTMKYRKSSESKVHHVEIQKSDSVNFTYFSFYNHTQKNLEPANDSYDIIFMPYYDLVYGIVDFPLPYRVRGVILNNSRVEALMVTTVPYESITYQDIVPADFVCEQNLIGWDWKDVKIDFAGGTATYNVLTNRVYLVKTFEGNYYKMRFLSYTLNGIYGYPRFEYELLEP